MYALSSESTGQRGKFCWYTGVREEELIQYIALTILSRINCVNAVSDDLEVAGRAIHRWVIRAPSMDTLF